MRSSIRNIALIAHVDHGKTTLVDAIIRECEVLDTRREQGSLILDSHDLERERGITIVSKNVSVTYQGVKINILDTPGHSDFGGEVERVLRMADGVLLLVDAFEGPMPQTRFVLGKALALGLTPIVVINKVDKPNCRPEEVQNEVFELMFSLDAGEEQLDFVTLFGSARQGWMSYDWRRPGRDIRPLLDTILTAIPEAPRRPGPLQMQIASLDYSSFVGRIAIGRVYRGTLRAGDEVLHIGADGSRKKAKVRELFLFEGLERKKSEKACSGDLCAVVGLEDFAIGDTLTDPEHPEPLPRIHIDEPTMSMLFTINDSPFYGLEGKYVTSRQLRERLFRETEKNLALRVETTASEDAFTVYGRGVLHLSILVETMRREGYEFQVGKPRVLTREIDGRCHEPVEELVIDLPEGLASRAIDLVTRRRGELRIMEQRGDRHHLVFSIPSRGLIGLRSQLLTATAGEAVIAHRLEGYEPCRGPVVTRTNGSLVSLATGKVLAYALDKLQDRGRFFVSPGEEVYKGQVVGEHNREGDLEVNVLKGKKLTNMRAAGSDTAVRLAPPVRFSLEEAMEYIRDDEYLEVTPRSLRMRKIPR